MKIQHDPDFPVTVDAVRRVEGWEKVVAFLGHWPSFTDMEVIELKLQRLQNHPSIYADLYAQFYIYDLSKSPDDPTRNQAFVDLLFIDLYGLKIEGWGYQNPLQGLSLHFDSESSRFAVKWGGGLGHEAEFTCGHIQVIRLRSRNPFEESQGW